MAKTTRATSKPVVGDSNKALRHYWDDDAVTYELWHEHRVGSAGERAAWAGVLSRLLPPPGARLLDVGAGTGFLSLAAARLGYDVTALDLSPGMLEQLRQKAASEGLSIHIVCLPAHEPPVGPFDAVMERQVLWMQPDPRPALEAWRAVTHGPLLAFEIFYNRNDYVERLRSRARSLLLRARRLPPEHHDPSPDLQAALPPPSYPSPSDLVGLIEAVGWRSSQLLRLRDVEWARQLALPRLEQLVGVRPEYVITAS